jgi:spore germination cell wall hydrolase CwlJ-like protein
MDGRRITALMAAVAALFVWLQSSVMARQDGPDPVAATQLAALPDAATEDAATEDATAPDTAPQDTATQDTATRAGGPEFDVLPLDDELTCLALNIYFEARSEPMEGKLAVAHVVLNRVGSDRFPETICAVVRQGGERTRHRCQFSWWCDGQSDEPRNPAAWDAARLIAWFVYHGETADPTDGSLWYHADYVDPYWREAFNRGPQIGRHIFYRSET